MFPKFRFESVGHAAKTGLGKINVAWAAGNIDAQPVALRRNLDLGGNRLPVVGEGVLLSEQRCFRPIDEVVAHKCRTHGQRQGGGLVAGVPSRESQPIPSLFRPVQHRAGRAADDRHRPLTRVLGSLGRESTSEPAVGTAVPVAVKLQRGVGYLLTELAIELTGVGEGIHCFVEVRGAKARFADIRAGLREKVPSNPCFSSKGRVFRT